MPATEEGAPQELSPRGLVERYLDPGQSEDARASYAQQIWQRYEGAPLAVKVEVRTAFRAGLKAKDARVRRSALTTLSQLVGDEVADVVIEWLHDPAASDVRAAAITCANRLKLREQAAKIRSYIGDADPDVQIAAVKAVSGWGDAGSRSAIAEAAKSSDPRVARAAKGALRRLDRVRKP